MAQIPILYHFVMVNSCRTSQFYAYVLETGRTLWYTSNAGDARGFSQGLHGGIQTWPRPAQPEMGILVARIASLTSMLDGVKNMVASHCEQIANLDACSSRCFAKGDQGHFRYQGKPCESFASSSVARLFCETPSDRKTGNHGI